MSSPDGKTRVTFVHEGDEATPRVNLAQIIPSSRLLSCAISYVSKRSVPSRHFQWVAFEAEEEIQHLERTCGVSE